MRHAPRWALPLVLIPLISASLLLAQRAPAAKRVWRVDLSSLGINHHSWQWSFSAHHSDIQVIGGSIAYARNGHVGVAFITQAVGGRIMTLQSVEESRKLHLISLDASTGRVVAVQTWPAPYSSIDNSVVGATRTGDFVILNERKVIEFSPDLREISSFDLPPGRPGYVSDWSLLFPPDGDSVFVQLGAIRGMSVIWSLHMLSVPCLRELRSWDGSGQIAAASSKYIASMGSPVRASAPQEPPRAISAGNERARVYVRGVDTKWRELSLAKTCPAGWPPRSLGFATDSSLLAVACNGVEVLSVDGRILFTKRFPQSQQIYGAWASPNGRFIAVALRGIPFGIRMANIILEPLDMQPGSFPWRVFVYNTKDGRLVNEFKPTWSIRCAFSPNGSRLAALNGRFVELYDVQHPHP